MKLSTLYKSYWERHAKLRLKCPANVHYWYAAHGPRWAESEVEFISTGEVQDWFDDLAIKSKSAAVRAVNMLSAIINWGIRRGYFTCSNPCKSVEKIKMRSRERFLMPEEISKFKRALAKENQDLQDIFWILVFTGARKSNVLSLEWSEIDTILAVWRIPPEKHKNGETQLNPLTDPVLAILDRRSKQSSRELARVYGRGKFVFPGKGKTGHVADIKRSWARILKRANIPDLRIHDLRRTYGSYMAINGESPYIIGKALGHIDQRSTAVYARLNLAPVRKAIEGAQSAFL